jgi:hypothetical protein
MIPNGEADQGTDSYMKLPILAPPSSRAGQIASVRPETPLTAIRSNQEATPAADLVVFDKQLRVLTARAKRHMATVRRNDADRDGGEFSILLGLMAPFYPALQGCTYASGMPSASPSPEPSPTPIAAKIQAIWPVICLPLKLIYQKITLSK